MYNKDHIIYLKIIYVCITYARIYEKKICIKYIIIYYIGLLTITRVTRHYNNDEFRLTSFDSYKKRSDFIDGCSSFFFFVIIFALVNNNYLC